MNEQIVDIGVNLMHRQFAEDREQVRENAEHDGVFPLILTGTSLRSAQECSAYAEKHPGKLYSTAGVHPHDAKSCNAQTMDALRTLAKKPHVVAIGECGLDYNRDFSPRDVQRKYFEQQIDLAIEEQLPLFLHERDAFQDFYTMLKAKEKQISAMVVHCFTGNQHALDNYLSLGAYIGITGWICDERRGQQLQQLVKRVPIDRLMIETDAPFLVPRDMKPYPTGGRNEPKFLRHVLEATARYVEMDAVELAKATTANAKKFFGIS